MNGHVAFEHALDELGTTNILDVQNGGPIPPAQVNPPSRPLHTRVFSVWLQCVGSGGNHNEGARRRRSAWKVNC